jgi:hypothetical protein
MHMLPAMTHFISDPPSVHIHVGARLDAMHPAVIVLDEILKVFARINNAKALAKRLNAKKTQ